MTKKDLLIAICVRNKARTNLMNGHSKKLLTNMARSALELTRAFVLINEYFLEIF